MNAAEQCPEHYADDPAATHLVHVVTMALGYRGRRTLYACPECLADAEADAAELPDYYSHTVGTRA